MKQERLFGNESLWVNVDVDCDDCGTHTVSYLIAYLVNNQPDYVCPVCEKFTGQRTIVHSDDGPSPCL